MKKQPYIFSLLGISLFAVVTYYSAFAYFKDREILNSQARVALYQSTLESELERIAYLPYVLSHDPEVIAAAQGTGRAALNVRLQKFAGAAGVDAIYLMDQTGVTVSTSNYDDALSYLNQNYGFRPYFRDSLDGDRGELYAIGATTLLPGYFVSEPVFDAARKVIGVIAIKLNLAPLENRWNSAGENVLLVNRDSIVMLSSNPKWRFRALNTISAQRRVEIMEDRQFGNSSVEQLDWMANKDNTQVSIKNKPYLLVSTDIEKRGWQLHLLVDEQAVKVRVWMLLVTLGVIGTSLFGLDQLRRAMKIGKALQASQADYADLSEANARLAVEVEERKRAEKRLKSTQNELEKTGRLAALGQLSISVTHELGQPIAAMKNYLIAAELSNEPIQVTVLSQLSGLVNRMENITRQLKFFAHNGDEHFQNVDVKDIIKGAEELLMPDMVALNVHYYKRLVGEGLIVRGNQQRLEQVLTNIIRNAIDSMRQQDNPEIHVFVELDGKEVIIGVSDTGAGIGRATIDDLQVPFYTTRASGEGMGLGLAISSEIVQEHNGRIVAENQDHGGALFKVILPIAEKHIFEEK